MARVRTLTLIVLLLLPFTLNAQLSETVEQAAQAYVEGNYLRAITLYDQVLLAQQDGALYYNLGAAHYAASDPARALWSFRQAARYLPRDATVQAAIARIRADLQSVPAEETNPLFLLADTVSGIITLYELSILGFLLWVGLFAALSAGIVRDQLRSMSRYIAGGTATALLIILVLLGVVSFVQTQHPAGVVIAENAQVMNGPGTDFLPLFILENGAEFRVLERDSEWLRFALRDGTQGWLQDSNVKLIPNNLG